MSQNHSLFAMKHDSNGISSVRALHNGEPVLFRPLQGGDTMIFGRYLEALSDQTRSKFAPHGFTAEAAQALCEQTHTDNSLRMLAVTGQAKDAEVIAYFILDCAIDKHDRRRFLSHGIELDEQTDCRFAPSVLDQHQDSGVGSLLMPSCMDIARRMGYLRIILLGGVYASNYRAIRFYEKHGFRIVGSFGSGPNKEESYDMIVSIA